MLRLEALRDSFRNGREVLSSWNSSYGIPCDPNTQGWQNITCSGGQIQAM